ncbi:MAG: hypothetical protein WBW49_08100, partial [Candidatus Acidiferrum sp.]
MPRHVLNRPHRDSTALSNRTWYRTIRYKFGTFAEQIALGFGIDINKDVVRRILAAHYQPPADRSGPSWLTFLGHAK